MSSAADTATWSKRIRFAFWSLGIPLALIMAYTTRYFINGDAIVYIEMGEAFRKGDWAGLVNLTYSPGYPVLLGIAQAILNTNPLNELQYLRTANIFCFVLALVACEFVMSFVNRDLERRIKVGEHPLPLPLIQALCYAMFLVCTLVLIRVRLLNPDMLVCVVVLTCMGIILRIRERPESYLGHALLGATMGIGYLVKSFFFPFAPIWLAVAGSCSTSWRKALPRLAVVVLAMALVSAPLVGALSARLGRFTYGELGRHIYAMYISGKGEPIYPQVLAEKPLTHGYVSAMPCTRPSGFDICYWHLGLEPDINLYKHARIIPSNILDIFEQTPWLLVIAVWFALQWIVGSVRPGPLRPPSHFLLLMAPGVLGSAFYALVKIEPRYIAPYLFLAFVALTIVLRYDPSRERIRRFTLIAGGVLTTLFLGLTCHSLVDQTVRGLYSSEKTVSYRDAYAADVAIKNFLEAEGLKPGDRVALVGCPPVYWARMAGLKIVGETENEQEYLGSSPAERANAHQALSDIGIKAAIAKGEGFGALAREGWRPVPGTGDYYAFFLNSRPIVPQGKTAQ